MVRLANIIRLALGASLVTAPLTLRATAELLVSGVRGIDGEVIGATFPDDHVFNLPANFELSLRNVQTNASYIMREPNEGTLSHFIESCNGILASMHRYCRQGDTGAPVGGLRGSRRPSNG
jgi:hypothetical protein